MPPGPGTGDWMEVTVVFSKLVPKRLQGNISDVWRINTKFSPNKRGYLTRI